MSDASRKAQPSLLCTVTGEPFQPARLYYSLPSKLAATRAFRELRCMEEDRSTDRWVWLYAAEAAGVTFGLPYEKIPVEAHPIIIGSFRFPKSGGLVLAVHSFERALAAACFFGPRFGPRVVLRRARVLNRWFGTEAAQVSPAALDGHLDRNVCFVGPGAERARRQAAAQGTQVSAADAYVHGDLPEVEDFPLAPQEETAEFFHLGMTLKLRSLRAHEHWQGNTHITLRDIIYRLFGQSAAKGSAHLPPGR
jgi:hypothetical protein